MLYNCLFYLISSFCLIFLGCGVGLIEPNKNKIYIHKTWSVKHRTYSISQGLRSPLLQGNWRMNPARYFIPCSFSGPPAGNAH